MTTGGIGGGGGACVQAAHKNTGTRAMGIAQGGIGDSSLTI